MFPPQNSTWIVEAPIRCLVGAFVRFLDAWLTGRNSFYSCLGISAIIRLSIQSTRWLSIYPFFREHWSYQCVFLVPTSCQICDLLARSGAAPDPTMEVNQNLPCEKHRWLGRCPLLFELCVLVLNQNWTLHEQLLSPAFVSQLIARQHYSRTLAKWGGSWASCILWDQESNSQSLSPVYSSVIQADLLSGYKLVAVVPFCIRHDCKYSVWQSYWAHLNYVNSVIGPELC